MSYFANNKRPRVWPKYVKRCRVIFHPSKRSKTKAMVTKIKVFIMCLTQRRLKPYNKSFIDQACSVKMFGYWPSFLFYSWICFRVLGAFCMQMSHSLRCNRKWNNSQSHVGTKRQPEIRLPSQVRFLWVAIAWLFSSALNAFSLHSPTLKAGV